MRVSKGALIAGVLLFVAAVLLVPAGLRSLGGNNSLISPESYYHLDVAKGDGPFSLFHLLLRGFLGIAHPLVAGRLLPWILGVLAAGLSFLVLRAAEEEWSVSLVAVVLLATSPVFLMLFTVLSPFSLVLVVFLWALFLMLRSSWWIVVPLVLFPFIDGPGFLLSAVVLLALSLVRGDSRKVLWASLFGLLAGAALFAGTGVFFFGSLFLEKAFSDILVGSGSLFGYSFFLFILACIGVSYQWSKRAAGTTILLVVASAASIFFPVGRVVLLPLFAFFGAHGLMRLVRKGWSVSSIRSLTLFLVYLSLLFVFILSVTSQAQSEPDIPMLEALYFLRTSGLQDVVLSAPENGVFIRSIAGREPFLDQASSPDSRRERVATELFYAMRMEGTIGLLKQERISHILIDRHMRDGGVWTSSGQGLLFLLQNEARFVKVFDNGEVQVYRVVPD